MFKKILFILIISFSFLRLEAQEMQFMGSLQSIFLHRNNEVKITNNDMRLDINEDMVNNSFALQQLDLMFTNVFDYNIKTFVDLTFNWNYNSEKDWGQFGIQEAWAQYSLGDKLNIQFGQIIPRFTHNNELRNKLPLLPYIIRPVYYENILNSVFSVEDLMPARSFVQVYGLLPVFSNLRFDYSLFAGNSEDNYIIKNRDTEQYLLSDYISGIDPNSTKEKLLGARLGFHTASESARIGVSITHDYDNRTDSIYNLWKSPTGDLERLRLGWDMSFNFYNIEFDWEFIYVGYDIDEDNIKFKNMEETPKLMSQKEYYIISYMASVLYNIDDSFFIYSRINTINNNIDHLSIKDFSVGAGYKILPNFIAKLQYLNHDQSYEIGNNKILYFDYDSDMLVFALSVLF